MKILKLVLLLFAVMTIGYFSWSSYSGRSLKEKHERATLVFEECCSTTKISCLERYYAYEKKI